MSMAGVDALRTGTHMTTAQQDVVSYVGYFHIGLVCIRMLELCCRHVSKKLTEFYVFTIPFESTTGP